MMVIQKRDTARTLGNLGSTAAVAGTLLGLRTAASLSYRSLYFAVGLFVIVGGILLLFLFSGRPMGIPFGRKVTLRRRYWLYYTLSFLLGSRRRIVALPAYFQKIAVTKDEITGNLSVEQAIQHIAAIIVPLIGGIVWEKSGIQAPFLFGVGSEILLIYQKPAPRHSCRSGVVLGCSIARRSHYHARPQLLGDLPRRRHRPG